MGHQKSFHGRYIAPRLVHCGCSADAFACMRERIVPRARGIVVEVGFGSGLNLPHYDPRMVELLIGIEPNETMLELAEGPLAATPFPVELHKGFGERLPLKDAIADTVVVTYALCTIPSPEKALKEIRRILKADGRLLFCEHAAASGWRASVQRGLNGAWSALFGGCKLTRDPLAMIKAAGFAVEDVAAKPFPVSLILLGTHYSGQARMMVSPMQLATQVRHAPERNPALAWA
jgi:SAM-dependent methyltransferase